MNYLSSTKKLAIPKCNFLTDIVSYFLIKASLLSLLTESIQRGSSLWIATSPRIVHQILEEIKSVSYKEKWVYIYIYMPI